MKTLRTRTSSLSIVNELINLGYRILSTKVIGYVTIEYKMFKVII